MNSYNAETWLIKHWVDGYKKVTKVMYCTDILLFPLLFLVKYGKQLKCSERLNEKQLIFDTHVAPTSRHDTHGHTKVGIQSNPSICIQCNLRWRITEWTPDSGVWVLNIGHPTINLTSDFNLQYNNVTFPQLEKTVIQCPKLSHFLCMTAAFRFPFNPSKWLN